MDEVEQNIVICQWLTDQLIGRNLKAEANNIDLRDSEKSQYFAMTKFNFYHSITELFFNEDPWEAKRSAIFTQERSQEGEKRGFFYA